MVAHNYRTSKGGYTIFLPSALVHFKPAKSDYTRINETELHTLIDAMLISRGIIEPCTEPKSTVNTFTVAETHKKRRRLIAEPVLNEYALHKPPTPMETPTADTVRDEAAFTFDLPWYYGHDSPHSVQVNTCRVGFRRLTWSWTCRITPRRVSAALHSQQTDD